MAAERKKKTIDEQIDENLKKAFGAIAGEPVPERFTKLLEELRASEKRPGPDSGGTE